MRMHHVDWWRFGESLSLGGRATRCKNDWGFAESVKPVAYRHVGFGAPLFPW